MLRPLTAQVKLSPLGHATMRRTTEFHSRISTRLVAVLFACLLSNPQELLAQDSTGTPISSDIAESAPAAVRPAPPTNASAADMPDDHGHTIVVSWDLSADDGQGTKSVMSYRILRTPKMTGPVNPDSTHGDSDYRVFASLPYGDAAWKFVEGEWDTLGEVPSGSTRYVNEGGKDRDQNGFLPDGVPFRYKVLSASVESGLGESETSAPAQSTGQYLHNGKLLHIGIPCLIFMLLVLGFVRAAQMGRELYIRPLAGISAVDEAIGRATEMNRPILYVLGLGAVDEIATIASLTILSRVAKRVAEHRTELLVPCYDAVVMTVAQETVKQAYLDAGRPDEYKEDIVYFVTQEQFAYVAAVNGTMLRRQTATNFYLGVFYAESLILAETGSVAGSIQIAGTDRTTQIPFFVVACDYTLIGEEVFAASAYLSREPKLLGALKAQDYAKAIVLLVLVGGCLGAIFAPDTIAAIFSMNF